MPFSSLRLPEIHKRSISHWAFNKNGTVKYGAWQKPLVYVYLNHICAEWSCDRCTYKQPATSTRCEMCQNPNPFIVNTHESYQSHQSTDYHPQPPSSTTPTQPSHLNLPHNNHKTRTKSNK